MAVENVYQNHLRDVEHFLVDAALVMEPNDQIVYMKKGSGDNSTYAVTLPYVRDAKGRIYIIHLIEKVGGTGKFAIDDKGDDAGWSTVNLTADGDVLVVISNGLRWLSLLDIST